jgi:GNAT superfamily N-acetyltransferase
MQRPSDRAPEVAVTALRTFIPADLGAVYDLIQRTIDSRYPPVYPPRAVAYFKRYHSRENILKRSVEGLLLVVVDDDGRYPRLIVATGAVVRTEITGVFVAPEHQGRGLGRLVMDRLESAALAAGHGSVCLSVSLPSRGFYEGRGYRLSGLLSDDVGEGQRLDHWEAEKPLAGGGPEVAR